MTPDELGTIINLVEQIDIILESLDIGSGYYDNSIGKQLGINYAKDFSKYYDYLTKLYRMLEEEDLLTDDLLNSYYYLREIDDEIHTEALDRAHQEVMDSVEEGDKVRLSNGNEFYVVSIDGNSLWVSRRRGGPEGWHADLYDVVEILEKGY